MPYFKEAAKQYDIPLEILLAVASRETQIGTNSYYRKNNFTGTGRSR
ncbi:hypothetical protein [Fodinibius sp.]|nr:hypothetical protein [Fodinibius sp.]MDZ7658837.1 hypothetical protein [Fodinibius sp.]